MAWDDFDIFCHVALHGSFSEAARVLNRPKSSVSTAVARLEARLRVRLMERTTRQVRLTEAGLLLYQGASPLFSELGQLATEVRHMSRDIGGTLRVAAPYEYGAHHLGHVAERLLVRHPGLHIHLDVEHTDVDPFSKNYDIVFSMTDRELRDSSVVASRVFTLERGLFAAPGFLAGCEPVQTPTDLETMPLICGTEEKEWWFSRDGGEEFRVPVRQPRLRSANANVRKQVAIGGGGVVRVTRTFCDAEVQLGILQPVLEGYDCQPLRVYALLPERRLMPPKVRVFLTELSAVERGGSSGIE